MVVGVRWGKGCWRKRGGEGERRGGRVCGGEGVRGWKVAGKVARLGERGDAGGGDLRRRSGGSEGPWCGPTNLTGLAHGAQLRYDLRRDEGRLGPDS